MVNPREECKAVSVTIVEETPVKEEKVETKPKASFIAPFPPPLLAEDALPSPPPKLKSEGKSKPLSKFLEVFACLGVNMPLLKNLKETPAYVHSMKELLLKKRTLKKGDTAVMSMKSSEFILRK
ncbi:hypothetical protein PIB30_113194, partial [Stylosanthes scabra]|nr:hypothetical protein [Stylosanthes scabra]